MKRRSDIDRSYDELEDELRAVVFEKNSLQNEVSDTMLFNAE